MEKYYRNKRSETVFIVVSSWESVDVTRPEGQDRVMCYQLWRMGAKGYRWVEQDELDDLYVPMTDDEINLFWENRNKVFD